MPNMVRNERSLWAQRVAKDWRTISISMRMGWYVAEVRGQIAEVKTCCASGVHLWNLSFASDLSSSRQIYYFIR
jgi:hypothetical protein